MSKDDSESTEKLGLTIHKHGDHYHATAKYPYPTAQLPKESESSEDEEV